MKGFFRRKAKDYGDNAPELLAAKDYGYEEPELPAGIHTGLVRYTLQQLGIATNYFSSNNKIGEGRFGSVFRGEIDYRAVTVKRLVARYHIISDADFIGRINVLSRIDHRNIISLVGFCVSNDERLLVFDFADNRSLAYHLHESDKGEGLDWGTRRKIALGTARALAYLHHDCEPQIIHRDINPSNILLNSEFEAQVSGYDFAKLYPDSACLVTSMIAGTRGYIDPHYFLSRSLTDKADVYSFGTMILEIITGVKPMSEEFKEVRRKVVKALKENMFEDIVDPRLLRDYDPEEVTCMAACAVVSTYDSPRDRPDMEQISNVLEGHQTPDSFIRQVLDLVENYPSSCPVSLLSFLVSSPPKSFTYFWNEEDTEDMESLTWSSNMFPPALSSYINPLPSSSEGDLVAIGEDMNSLPFSSDMNPPASSSSEGGLAAIGEDMKSLPISSDINPPASSSSEGYLAAAAIGEDMKSLPFSSDMNPPASSSSGDIAFGFVKYTLQQLETATNNFSKHNVLGKGGFATVYKGNLENGPVAIKKLTAGDERRDENFKIEINAISRVSHVNIISLVGYCIDGSARLLVYELAPNGSLADHLGQERRSTLDWETRKKIMLGTAKALEYLHDNCKPRIVHRDIKAENVLLSSKFEAKLGDLGIAKLQPTSFASQQSFTDVKGTRGYLDPYYYFSSIFTPKSDVYSFGILLLVSVTGFAPSQELEEAKGKLERALGDKNYNDIADKCLNNVYDLDGMQRIVACAAVSTLPSPDDRPTMEEIVDVMRGVVSPDGFIKKYLSKKNHK